jgi:hypothetical protein
MQRTVITISCAAVAFGGLLGSAASASPPAGAPASCVGIITTAEAAQLPPGSIGQEVSGLATSAPGLGQALVSPLAHEHGPNCG